MSEKGFIICAIICVVLFTAPLAITSIVLGATSSGCDYVDSGTNLNVAQYLIGLGVISLILAFLILVIAVSAILSGGHFSAGSGCAFVLYIILLVATMLVSGIWFIIGAVILFRSNVDCIRAGTTHVIYALVLWAITAFEMVLHCCYHRQQSTNDNS